MLPVTAGWRARPGSQRSDHISLRIAGTQSYSGCGRVYAVKGWGLLGAQACKWAAITSVVIAQPVIGKVSQVGVERVFGTLLGGLFGFAAFRWPPPSTLPHSSLRTLHAEFDTLRHAPFQLCSQ